MIQIDRSGVTYSESANERAALRARFEAQHYVQVSNFLEPGLLRFLNQQIERGKFYERVHEGIGSNKELCMAGNTAVGALLLVLNDEKLFRLIQDITQCRRIECFEGRIYRVYPNQGHHDSWHDDIGEDRLVGMSINLGQEDYVGGVLQIRNGDSKKIVAEVRNTSAGGAVIFRLSQSLQHRITEVEGAEPKTAFAGWFRANSRLGSLLKRAP